MNKELEEYKASIEFKIAMEKTFSVTIKAWMNLDKWAYNVYANIFESHELFNKPDEAMLLPLNGGCTYDQLKTSVPSTGIQYEWQREVKTLVVGSDYMHIHDEYDNHSSPFEHIPYKVLNDAKELAEALR